MTSSSHPWFRLLIGWCCLMSSALLIMTVYLANFETNLVALSDFWHGPSFSDYIRLIRDKEKTWICSKPCESSFVSLENSTVVVTVSGLYYFHAQVYFKQITQTNEMPTVTLIKNKGPGTELRKLSEVKRNGPGSLTMICLVKLNKGDSISLNINHINGLSGEDYDTFLEIILFNK
uniref:Lymphotoxin alpha (TNF superfamily, member 1) n=1 Tax=Cyprinus carpio TaxID=7962 RepID=A0A8C1KUI9_CYPCA